MAIIQNGHNKIYINFNALCYKVYINKFCFANYNFKFVNHFKKKAANKTVYQRNVQK